MHRFGTFTNRPNSVFFPTSPSYTAHEINAVTLSETLVNPMSASQRYESANNVETALTWRPGPLNQPKENSIVPDLNKFPDLPLICDPSHICGRRDIIKQTSQKALDLNFDGLMIETHNDPDNAWSDSAQQITPKTLINLMKDLVTVSYTHLTLPTSDLV